MATFRRSTFDSTLHTTVHAPLPRQRHERMCRTVIRSALPCRPPYSRCVCTWTVSKKGARGPRLLIRLRRCLMPVLRGRLRGRRPRQRLLQGGLCGVDPQVRPPRSGNRPPEGVPCVHGGPSRCEIGWGCQDGDWGRGGQRDELPVCRNAQQGSRLAPRSVLMQPQVWPRPTPGC